MNRLKLLRVAALLWVGMCWMCSTSEAQKYQDSLKKVAHLENVRDTVPMRQMNGKIVHLVTVHTPAVDYIETLDGYTVVLDMVGYFCYAVPGKKGDLVAGPYAAKNEIDRDPKEDKWLKKKDKHLRYKGKTLAMLEEKYIKRNRPVGNAIKLRDLQPQIDSLNNNLKK